MTFPADYEDRFTYYMTIDTGYGKTSHSISTDIDIDTCEGWDAFIEQLHEETGGHCDILFMKELR